MNRSFSKKRHIQESNEKLERRSLTNHMLNEQSSDLEIEEGSTWEGIKGWFGGRGYYYTKYLTQVQEILEKLNKKVNFDKKIKNDLDEILDKVAESSMEEPKKDRILKLLIEISEGIKTANEMLEKKIHEIERLKRRK